MRIVSMMARALTRLLLAPGLLLRGGNPLTIQEETGEAAGAQQFAGAAVGQTAGRARLTRRAHPRAPMILLLALVAVELVWIAVIGYLLYLAI